MQGILTRESSVKIIECTISGQLVTVGGRLQIQCFERLLPKLYNVLLRLQVFLLKNSGSDVKEDNAKIP